MEHQKGVPAASHLVVHDHVLLPWLAAPSLARDLRRMMASIGDDEDEDICGCDVILSTLFD